MTIRYPASPPASDLGEAVIGEHNDTLLESDFGAEAIAHYRAGWFDGLRAARALLIGNQALTGEILDNLIALETQ